MEELCPPAVPSEWGEGAHPLLLGCLEPPSHIQQSSGQYLTKNVGLKG